MLDQPGPVVLVSRLDENSVDLTLQAWAKTKDFVNARSQLTEDVRTQLIGNGLNIPYPRRDLHVYHYNADGTPLTEIAARAVADEGGDTPANTAS